jgi:hypothetical protein
VDVKCAADLYSQGWSLRQIAAELVLTCSYESCALEFESPRQLQCDGFLRLRLDSLLRLMHYNGFC